MAAHDRLYVDRAMQIEREQQRDNLQRPKDARHVLWGS